ncbi:MAG TPA: SIMPL domain-containing protein [Streptosporangiaceae bacterium]|nr:SIMPL domain-containing protein [Streptosporangiaceae bacterium]
MIVNIKPIYRPIAIGIVSAAVLIGAFLLGSAQPGSAASESAADSHSAGIVLTSSGAGGKITVTGTGTVSGTPDQLVLSMGVQTSASSVSAALAHANGAARRVIGALKSGGVHAADIQTSGLSISPNYSGNSQVPVGYGVSEQLTATLRALSKAGSQIQAAVTAGGNATTVDGVSLNLADTSGLLARARTSAVRDAQAKAAQFARALGRPLGGVISISDQSATIPYPEFSASGAARAAPSVPISPGKQQVSVQITVVYAIG